MRLNTAESKKLGRKIHGAFGTWQAARAASERVDGVNVIRELPTRTGSNSRTRPDRKTTTA